jgi:hypothetical protein
VPKDGSPTDGLEESKGQTGPRSEASVNDEAKPNAEEGLQEVAAEQNPAQDDKAKVRTKAGTNLRQSQNRIVQFPKPDHLVSPDSGQKKTSRTTMPEMAPASHLCPLGLMAN